MPIKKEVSQDMSETQLLSRQLTLGQIDFVRYICTVALNNGSLAYQKAYPSCKSGYRQNARRLLTYDYIKQAIADYKAKIRAEKGFTVEDVHKLYEGAYDLAKDKHQTGSMVGAATGIARLYGMDRDAGGSKEQTIIIIGPKTVTEPARAIESEEVDG